MIMKLSKWIFHLLLAAVCVYLAVTEQYVMCVNLAIFLAVCPVLILLAEWIVRLCQKGLPTQQRRSIGSTALMYTIYLMAAACLLRYSAAGYAWQQLSEGIPSIGIQLCDALFGAVRSVGIPEDYLDFITAFKGMWSELYPQQEWQRTVLVHFATLLNVAIPVAGSTLVLGMFAQIFPRFLLWLKYKNPFRKEKCYFSGLNPQSLALAKSILLARREEGKWIAPLLIFTDAYVDDESEQSYELMLEAKRLGAVCVRDDLAHVPKARLGERKYFLMEEDEYANLPALMGLVEEHNVAYLKNAAIYLFVQSDMYVRLEQKIRRQLTDSTNRKKVLSEEDLPAIIPVNAHRNLVNNLMVDVPLYEPLVGKDKSELNITVFGNGSIGTEAFLSAYWFGQMMVCRKDKMGEETLTSCHTTIHVVSQDDEDTFWSKIDSINPDIRRTTQEGDLLLQWRPGQYNQPYCTVRYHKADVKSGTFRRSEAKGTTETVAVADEQTPAWLDADYVIVALGSDSDNVAVANKMRAHIGKRHLEDKNEPKNTVIAYVVYNSDLCHALNANTQAEYGIYMYAFGALEEVYGCNNVFMTKTQLLAEEAHKAYYGSEEEGGKVQKGKRKKPSRTYNQMAEMARAMHIKYKLFSLGWITTSLFADSKEEHRRVVEEARRRYKRAAVVGLLFEPQLYAESVLPPMKESEDYGVASVLNESDYAKWKDLCKKRHHLAWLEHRRWCAYTRTMGYRSTDAMEKYYFTENDHKNMSLKLHPCLVEARHPDEGIKHTYVYTDEVFWRQIIREQDVWDIDPDADALDIHHLQRWRAMTDAWDILSGMQVVADENASEEVKVAVVARRKRIQTLRSNMSKGDHCKKYDYFMGEFPGYVLGVAAYAALAEYMDVSAEEWEKQCKRWERRGAFFCPNDEGGQWILPKDCVTAFVQERYPVTLPTSHYVGASLPDGAVPSPFVFVYDKVYYAKGTRRNRREVKRLEDVYKLAREKELTALLLAEREEKEKVKTANQTGEDI